MRMLALILSTCLVCTPVTAQTDKTAVPENADFVASNVIAILYHELGHALIDILLLPVFGQEEDAADTLSVLMMDAHFDDDAARAILSDTAWSFQMDDAVRAADGVEVAFWDVHGPDLQRLYNTVCLAYGASPETRRDMVEKFDLPEDRVETCEEEYEVAADSWGGALEEVEGGDGALLTLMDGEPSFLRDLARAEINALNALYSLDPSITVRVEECGEANAYYNGASTAITLCEELVGHLNAQGGQ